MIKLNIIQLFLACLLMQLAGWFYFCFVLNLPLGLIIDLAIKDIISMILEVAIGFSK